MTDFVEENSDQQRLPHREANLVKVIMTAIMTTVVQFCSDEERGSSALSIANKQESLATTIRS